MAHNKIRILTGDVPIEDIKVMNYLRLVVDHTLNWQEHVEKIYEKTISMIAFLFRVSTFVSIHLKNKFTMPIFLSTMRYMSRIWGICGDTAFNKV